ncbi:MAG TPA: hypothetical protein VEP90_08495 [Methylomirabilota bacterium]|nr:hypothetical protein [Ktedonobacteraceae bacterium]HYT42372.1 hypothetical protein [Methylomirabilota bacterium]
MDTIVSRITDFEQLRSLSELFLDSVEMAINLTIEHFQVSKHPFNPQFFASHVRSKLRECLELEATNFDFSILDLGSNSFYVVYKGFTIRFYKSQDGFIPPPGTSRARLAFYNANHLPFQIVLPGIEAVCNPPLTNQIHLIAYYTLDASNKLVSLKIAQPLYATSTNVDCLWDEEVENPFKSRGNHLDQPQLKPRDDIMYTFHEDEDENEDDLTELAE